MRDDSKAKSSHRAAAGAILLACLLFLRNGLALAEESAPAGQAASAPAPSSYPDPFRRTGDLPQASRHAPRAQEAPTEAAIDEPPPPPLPPKNLRSRPPAASVFTYEPAATKTPASSGDEPVQSSDESVPVHLASKDERPATAFKPPPAAHTPTTPPRSFLMEPGTVASTNPGSRR